MSDGTNYWGRYSYVKGTTELEKENELEVFEGYIDGYLKDISTGTVSASGVVWILNNDKVVRQISDNVLYLMDGYEIRIKKVDGDNVYVELSKYGLIADSKVIKPLKKGATLADQTYYYKNRDNLIIIALHFKNSYTVDAYWHICNEKLNLVLWPGEGQLADLINKYRKDNGLDPIPLTISMQKVARAHVIDLEEFHPDDGYCKNFVSSDHSWSNHGVWTPICFNSVDEEINTKMANKPREITGIIKPYKNLAEIVVGYKPGMTPKIAMQWWIGSAGHRGVILMKGLKFTDSDPRYWKSMGVSILGGHAVVWFGAGVDPAGGEDWIYSG